MLRLRLQLRKINIKVKLRLRLRLGLKLRLRIRLGLNNKMTKIKIKFFLKDSQKRFFDFMWIYIWSYEINYYFIIKDYNWVSKALIISFGFNIKYFSKINRQSIW